MFNWLKKLLHREQTSPEEKKISGVIFFVFIFLMGFGGNTMDKSKWDFYSSLTKPELTPPGWVFPIVWTILFALIGLSAYYAWNHYENEKYRKPFIGLFVLNGLLIFLWPQYFFAKQALSAALYIIIGMIIVSELMILMGFKLNQKTAYLLMPYLAWILFAAYLNISIIALNSPAG